MVAGQGIEPGELAAPTVRLGGRPACSASGRYGEHFSLPRSFLLSSPGGSFWFSAPLGFTQCVDA